MSLERRLSPRLPKLNNEVDFTILDYQDVDTFLSSNSGSDKGSITRQMAKQLKSLRGLLTISNQFTTSSRPEESLQKIIRSSKNIVNAEHIFLLQIDHQHGILTVHQSLDHVSDGVQTAIAAGVESIAIIQRKGVIVNDLSSSSMTINTDFYKQLKLYPSSLIIVPIISGETVTGLILALNKNARDESTFSSFDLSCLESIAVNISVIFQWSIYSKMGTKSSLTSSIDAGSISQLSLDVEIHLKEIVNDTYRLLGADRVSVFIDNGNQELLCILSPDIKGRVVSTLVGFVGFCFRNKVVVNVSDVKSDSRHFADIDKEMNYETISLISVPLIGVGGEVLGVLQAVNKRAGGAFSSANELSLQQIGHRVAILLSRLKSFAQQVSEDATVRIVRNLGEFSEEINSCSSDVCTSSSHLARIVGKYVHNIARHDKVYLLSLAEDSKEGEIILERKDDKTGLITRYQSAEVHPLVREAIERKGPQELPLDEDTPAREVLPGILAATALIIPLVSFSLNNKTEYDVMIVTRRSYETRKSSLHYVPSADSASDLMSLDGIFKNSLDGYSQLSFTAVESHGLFSLASILTNALHFHAQNKSSKEVVDMRRSTTMGRFDCPAVYSTLRAEDQAELQNLFDWHFNVLNLKDKASLHYAVVSLFDKECNFGELKISRDRVFSYILEVDRSYFDNPFHNFTHGVCVTHFNYMLLNASNAQNHLSPIMIFASLLSALVHDVAHPGNTNMFEINMRSDLALLYNDTSVLENHHCATAFRLMNKKGLDIFENIDFATRADIRKMMIACIIATDMHYHVSLIELIANRANQDKWIINSVSEQLNYGKILLHAADMSNPTRVFPVSRAWAELVSEEFNAQGVMEKAAGIPVSTFLLCHDLKSFVKNELFFSGHIVFPMWKELVRLFPSMSHITDQMTANLEAWKDLIR